MSAPLRILVVAGRATPQAVARALERAGFVATRHTVASTELQHELAAGGWDLVVDAPETSRHDERLAEMADSPELLEQAQAVAHVGSWVSGLGDSDPISWSRETYRIFGVSEGEPISVDRFFSFVHPQDRPHVRHESRAAIALGRPYDVVHRIVRPDGAVRTVHERATIVRDTRGDRMVGTVQDVTEQRLSESRDRLLADASARMSASFDYPSLLSLVAQLPVPRLGEGCLVVVLEGVTGTPRFAVAHRSADEQAAVRARLAQSRRQLRGLVGLLRDRQRVAHPPLPDDTERPPSAARRLKAELGARTLLGLPLQAHGATFGAIVLWRDATREPYDGFEASTANDFARLASLAIDNARLYHDAQAAVRSRDEFLSLAAHELKTPVTPLRLQTRSLLRHLDRAAEALPARLAAIDRATARLEQLIESLLEASELGSGELALELEEVDLADLAEHVVDEMSEELGRAGCPLQVSLRSASGRYDRRRLERALYNLLSNAAKFGPGQPVELSVGANGEWAHIMVRDHGIGIATADQSRLFQRFERLGPLRHYGGLGLGLWHVRQIVEAHGGHVHLRSRPGEGSTFTLLLPRQASVERGAPSPPRSPP